MRRLKSLLLLLFVGALLIIPTKARAASALLENITVEGVPTLMLGSNTYTIKYSTSFNYVNISATPKSTGLTVEGVGQLPIQAGANQYVVTATDGTTTETYTINLDTTIISGKASSTTTTVDPKTGEPITNPETGAFLNYSLVAISLLGALVVINKLKNKNKFYRI